MVPFTSNLYDGLVVLIPTLPLAPPANSNTFSVALSLSITLNPPAVFADHAPHTSV